MITRILSKLSIIFLLSVGAIFAQQTCPSGTVPVTSAGKTIISGSPSYAFCLNTTNGTVFVNGSVQTSTTASACAGTATLVAGTKTVTTTCAIGANDLIFITRRASNSSTAVGVFGVGTITSGTSFVINAYTAATASTVATGDLSTVSWMIVHTF